jgi:hypothetical protein
LILDRAKKVLAVRSFAAVPATAHPRIGLPPLEIRAIFDVTLD